MKKNLTLFVLILFVASCSQSLKNQFVLTGKIDGKVAQKAFLQKYEDGQMKVLDSAKISNGKFKFKGTLIEPDFYYIKIGSEDQLIPLFLENSKISVIAKSDSLELAKIEGSNLNDEYASYKESNAFFDNTLDALYSEYKKATDKAIQDAIEIKYDSIDNLKTAHIKEYVKSHGNTMLAAFIIRKELIYSIDLDELIGLTNCLSPELKENKYSKELYSRIEILRSLQPGLPAPDFSQTGVNGDTVSLSYFKGKFLLIDFWASWCSPCRKANPTVVAMYKKYSKKNFTILGVSMDDNKEKWIEAIAADQLNWAQVSTLEGWANPVGKLYAVNSIPHAILIGPDGKIIKRGVHADELDELLGNLLK